MLCLMPAGTCDALPSPSINRLPTALPFLNNTVKGSSMPPEPSPSWPAQKRSACQVVSASHHGSTVPYLRTSTFWPLRLVVQSANLFVCCRSAAAGICDDIRGLCYCDGTGANTGTAGSLQGIHTGRPLSEWCQPATVSR